MATPDTGGRKRLTGKGPVAPAGPLSGIPTVTPTPSVLQMLPGDGGGTPTPPAYEPGSLPPPNPNDPVYQLLDDFGKVVGIDWPAYYQAYDDWQKLTQAGGYAPGAGAAGPQDTPADYINSIIAGVQADIANRRLRTDQVVEEFNRRFAAFQEAGERFEGIQPYTIPTGSEYVPGFEPGGFGESVGLSPYKATPIQYNPFQMANDLVEGSPSVTDVGVPGGAEDAVAIAKKFLGIGG